MSVPKHSCVNGMCICFMVRGKKKLKQGVRVDIGGRERQRNAHVTSQMPADW